MGKIKIKHVYIDNKHNFDKIYTYINTTPNYKCSLNKNKSDIIITDSPNSLKEVSFETFKNNIENGIW